jgi:hypothetical protein
MMGGSAVRPITRKADDDHEDDDDHHENEKSR